MIQATYYNARTRAHIRRLPEKIRENRGQAVSKETFMKGSILKETNWDLVGAFLCRVAILLLAEQVSKLLYTMACRTLSYVL